MKRLGLDIGSTTMKYVLLGEDGVILTADYIRHGARIHEVCLEIREKLNAACPGQDIALTVSGSGGMGFAERLGLPCVLEVSAERRAGDGRGDRAGRRGRKDPVSYRWL